MTLNDYQDSASKTNEYPKENMLECLVFGLCSEAGEVAGKMKKMHRGDYHPSKITEIIVPEIADVLWYVAQICRELGVSLDHCATENLYKLKDRAERNKIKGDGDYR